MTWKGLVMFRQMINKFFGKITLTEVEAELENFVASISTDSTDLTEEELKNFTRVAIPTDWKDSILPMFSFIEKEKTKNAQRIFLRKIIINSLGEKYLSKYLLTEVKNNADLNIIAKEMGYDPNVSESELYEINTKIYLLNNLIVKFLRYLSGKHFNDSAENDYFNLLDSLSEQLKLHFYNIVLSNNKDEIYPFEIFLPVLRQQYDELCKIIVEGGNIDSSENNTDEEESTENEENEVEKVDFVSGEKLIKLTEILNDRYARLKNGTLYCFEDYTPVNPNNAVTIDSAIMWAGVMECVSGLDESEDAIKSVLFDWASSLDVPDEAREGARKEDISLDVQREILEPYLRNREGGWLSEVMLIVVVLLYVDDPSDLEKFSKQERETFYGKIGVGLMDDVWEVFAKTKNVFGHSLDEKGFFSE